MYRHRRDKPRSLAGFTVKAVGALGMPFVVQTGFIAFAPRAIGMYPLVVFGLSIGVGLVASRPKAFNASAVVLRLCYAGLMVPALGWWTLIITAGYFPDHAAQVLPHIDF